MQPDLINSTYICHCKIDIHPIFLLSTIICIVTIGKISRKLGTPRYTIFSWRTVPWSTIIAEITGKVDSNLWGCRIDRISDVKPWCIPCMISIKNQSVKSSYHPNPQQRNTMTTNPIRAVNHFPHGGGYISCMPTYTNGISLDLFIAVCSHPAVDNILRRSKIYRV